MGVDDKTLAEAAANAAAGEAEAAVLDEREERSAPGGDGGKAEAGSGDEQGEGVGEGEVLPPHWRGAVQWIRGEGRVAKRMLKEGK